MNWTKVSIYIFCTGMFLLCIGGPFYESIGGLTHQNIFIAIALSIMAIGLIVFTITGLKKREEAMDANEERKALRFVSVLVLLAIVGTVVSLLFFPVNEAHGQTLALGDRLQSGQNVALLGAGKATAIAVLQHGYHRFDVATSIIKTIDGWGIWGIGVGPVFQVAKSRVINMATYPTLTMFNDGWKSSLLSFMSVGSRNIIVTKPLTLIGYLGIMPSYKLANNRWRCDAITVGGLAIGPWYQKLPLGLLGEYDAKNRLWYGGLSYLF